MYETLHTDGETRGRIDYTVWSEVFQMSRMHRRSGVCRRGPGSIDRPTREGPSFRALDCDSRAEQATGWSGVFESSDSIAATGNAMVNTCRDVQAVDHPIYLGRMAGHSEKKPDAAMTWRACPIASPNLPLPTEGAFDEPVACRMHMYAPACAFGILEGRHVRPSLLPAPRRTRPGCDVASSQCPRRSPPPPHAALLRGAGYLGHVDPQSLRVLRTILKSTSQLSRRLLRRHRRFPRSLRGTTSETSCPA